MNAVPGRARRVSSSQPESHLLQVIEKGLFWTLPTIDILHIVKEEFHNELEHLKYAYSVRQHDWKEMADSPSRIIFPGNEVYDEVNRSLVGILALRWINSNDYEQFVAGQAESVKLQRDSFHWLRSIFLQQEIIDSTSYKLYALIVSMISNDLGKSTSFIEQYMEATGDDIGSDNHDMILHKSVQKGMVAAIENLRPEAKDELKRGIKLGAEFNVGQLAQAENAPASLSPVLSMVNHEEAWNMRWMEQLLDLAGAAGHEDHTCAKKLIEPIFRSYRSVYDIVTGIIQSKLTLREGYDQNLSTRLDLILGSGWKPLATLDIKLPQDRAILRIFCMANVASQESADLYYNTFHSADVGNQVRQQLVESLNRDGSVRNPAVQPTYGPGMLNLALSNLREGNVVEVAGRDMQRTIAAMLRYLTRVLARPPGRQIIAEGNVTVIERDCRLAIKDIINSQGFLDDPDILDNAPLPTDSVANRLCEVDDIR